MAKGNYTNKAAQNVQEFAKDKIETINKEKNEEKSKGGRPSKGAVKKITLAIPEELFESIEIASILFKGNRTAYINSLIKKDMEQNLEKYKEFKAMINQSR